MAAIKNVLGSFATFAEAAAKAKAYDADRGISSSVDELGNPILLHDFDCEPYSSVEKHGDHWVAVNSTYVHLAEDDENEDEDEDNYDDDDDDDDDEDEDEDHYVEPVSCGNCGGFGQSPTGGICPRCDGAGSFKQPSTVRWGPVESCRRCGGDGCDEMGYECDACKGKGKLSYPRPRRVR